MKLYIVVKDTVPDNMVPVLVAHTMLGAHEFFDNDVFYRNWYYNSFKKCVITANEKEWERIRFLGCPKFLGYESTVDDGRETCAIIQPVDDDIVPNVLKFARLWKPKSDYQVVTYRGTYAEGDFVYYDQIPDDMSEELRQKMRLTPLYIKND